MDTISGNSAQPCGCDPGVKWVCDWHQQEQARKRTPSALRSTVGAMPPVYGPVFTPPKGEKPTNPKNPISSNKVPMHLWPATATAYGSMGLLDGMLKYGYANYRVAGVRASIYIAALKRHIDQWYDAGEECASDSGVEHLGHALACLAIIIDAKEQGVLVDDRPPRSAFNRLCERLGTTVAELRKQHADKNPRHFTINDSDIRVSDPKENS